LIDSYIGKTFGYAFGVDITFAIETIKYYAGWADKITGQSIEVVCNWLKSTRRISQALRPSSGNFPCMFVPKYYDDSVRLMICDSAVVIVENRPRYASILCLPRMERLA
jgi:aldehyde dehydrogenase (NAD+)